LLFTKSGKVELRVIGAQHPPVGVAVAAWVVGAAVGVENTNVKGALVEPPGVQETVMEASLTMLNEVWE